MNTLATKQQELTALDRCDRCGAAAHIRVTLLNGELLFCAHHAREYSASLGTNALAITDKDGHDVRDLAHFGF